MLNTGYSFDPTGLSDQELKDYLNYFQTSAARDSNVGGATPSQVGYSGISQNILQRLKDEQVNRQAKASQSDQEKQLMSLFGGLGGSQSPGFDQQAYINDLQSSAGNERKSIEDIFNAQKQSGLQGLDEQYNPIRKQAIEEAAVLGNLRSPAFQSTTLANMDAARSRDTSNLLAQLGASRGQALAGVEQGLAGRLGQGRQFAANLGQQQNQLGLQRASTLGGLLQGNQQFGQNFGLQNRRFNAEQGQNAFENNLALQGLSQADQLGRMQADAQKKSGWDTFGSVVGGLGNLAGGIGGLAGGIRGLASSFGKGNGGGGGSQFYPISSGLMGTGGQNSRYPMSMRIGTGYTNRNFFG